MILQSSEKFIFGKFVTDEGFLTLDEAVELCNHSERVRDELQRYPFDKVCRVLRALSQCWANPEYHYRKIAMEKLPIASGYAPSMIQKGLDVMAGLLDPDFLERKIQTELRGIPIIERYEFDFHNGTAKQWQPLGVVLHVLAGNVFTGGVGSWIEGVLTRNVNILKMSSSERVFMPLFLSSLLEVDTDGVLSRATALVSFSSSQKDVMETLKQRVDGVVVWGGEEAVRGYRENLPARTRLIVFGPKLSMSLVTAQGLKERGVDALAGDLAYEMSVWDQNACTAPQICYVEGRDQAVALAECLAQKLELVQKEIPSGEIDLNSAVEIRKLRSLYEVNSLMDRGGYWSSGEDLRWSVFLDNDVDLQPSPLHRTIRVIPYEKINDVVDQVSSYRGYVQTVGLECGRDERLSLASELAKFGVIRVVGLGQMAGGEIDDPHDGAYDLPQLLNLVLVRSRDQKTAKIHPVDRLSESQRAKMLDSDLRRLMDRARYSQYYSKILKDFESAKGRSVEGVEDLKHLPILGREIMDREMPPYGQGLKTLQGSAAGGYVSRSGGSTGEPKYSIYDGHDWEKMISGATRVLRAAGLVSQDRVANCMIAGDLYGSFVSFDHVISRLGVLSFAFSTKVTPDIYVDIHNKFNLNVMLGVPPFSIPLLREAKELDPNLQLEKFIFAGQALSSRDEEWLRQSLGVKIISSVIGANDGGQIAYQCEFLQGAEHHVCDDFNYIEIVDEQGSPVPVGERGRILITSLHKYAFPLIRYAIGDAGRFIDKSCACGRTQRILEYLGRWDDVVSVGLLNLAYNDVVQALKGFFISVLQIAARGDESGQEYLVLRMESPDIHKVSDQEILQQLYKEIPVIEQRLSEGRLARIEIEKYRDGELPRNPRSTKVKSFVDER